jgi:hypothetical protein
MTAHWGIEDPAAVEGTDMVAFHCGEPDCRCPMAAAIRKIASTASRLSY